MKNFMKVFLLASFIFLFGGLSFSDDKDKKDVSYLIKPEFNKGDKLSAEQQQVFNAKVDADIYGDRGPNDKRGSFKEDMIETKKYTFIEECKADLEGRRDITVFEREYKEAIKETKKPQKNSKKETEKTSLHGKTVRVTLTENDENVKCLNGVLLPSDDEDVTFIDKVYKFALPDNEVKVGDKWDIESQKLGKALLGGFYDATNFSGKGDAILKGISKYDGKNCLQIVVRIKAEIARTKISHGLSFDLKGNIYFSTDDKKIIALEFSGPASIEGESKDDDWKVVFKGTGKYSVVYKAKIEAQDKK